MDLKNSHLQFFSLPADRSYKDSIVVSSGEILGSLANISQTTGLQDLFIHHEILAPGKRSSPAHFHTRKEEFVYVLRGVLSVWLDDTITQIAAGSAVGFPPNVPHMAFNQSDSETELLTVSCLSHSDDTCVFLDDSRLGFKL